MAGGIHAWEGRLAEGAPQSGMAYFSPAVKAEELIALASFLEDGSRKFYFELVSATTDGAAKDLYDQLAKAEEQHQAFLLRLYEDLSGKAPDPGFPGSVIPPGKEGDVMEGGMLVGEALEWAKEKTTGEILELALSLETNSYDLYLRMRSQMQGQRSAQVFHLLSGQEKEHLERLSSLFEKRI
jgi:sulfur-carrier protein adenylyltransferase/sulfurtransferase